MKYLKSRILAIFVSIQCFPAYAALTAPPAWADAGAQFFYFMTTQGLEWGLGIAAVGWGLTKMMNMESDWQKRVAQFTMGAGIAFAVPDTVMTLFGRTGYDLQIIMTVAGM